MPRTWFITGASRGIGKAIALAAGRAGDNVVVLGKTDQPHPRLSGTVPETVEEVHAAGGAALGCITDIRFEDQVEAAVVDAIGHFGRIDILVNNASAIFLAGTRETPIKRFDLMHSINARGTFLVSRACLPSLLRSENGHIVTISPPLNLDSKWFQDHVAYSMAKMGMSLCVLGMAAEFREQQLSVNALWPRTAIATAAVQNLLGGDEAIRRCRRPEIMADAIEVLVNRQRGACSGQFLIDEDVLREAGVTDFDQYQVEPGADLWSDFFID